jgi:hypothetical protein
MSKMRRNLTPVRIGKVAYTCPTIDILVEKKIKLVPVKNIENPFQLLRGRVQSVTRSTVC